jgi:hypothetical protein
MMEHPHVGPPFFPLGTQQQILQDFCYGQIQYGWIISFTLTPRERYAAYHKYI